MTPDYWDKAKTALGKRDPVLKAIIKSYKGEGMQLRGEGFRTLARAITGQQISTKAADSVWKKFEAAVGKVTPKNVANAPHEVLRPCGLSERKVLYMHALANHFLENQKTIKNWPKMSDDDIIAELTSIHGIGRWTAEMFLMFALGRPDVFPTLDLGLLKGIYRHYNNSEKMTKAEVLAIGERWRPYRSMATWYMWRVLDPVPISY
jgi:DNA-3-methyladenine glycosylase II